MTKGTLYILILLFECYKKFISSETVDTSLRDVDENTVQITDENCRYVKIKSTLKNYFILSMDFCFRERRSSRRSFKFQSVSKSSAIISKSSGKGALNSDDTAGDSRTKNILRDVSCCDNEASPIEISNGEIINLNGPKSLVRPNRRFPGVFKAIKRDLKVEKELASNGSERIFSTTSTSGKIYLLKTSNDRDPSKQHKGETFLPPLKYPSVNTFLTKKGFRSIMVLHTYEVRKLARLGGKMTVQGFNPLSKSNPTVWPYPSSRPFFKTCWLFRTLNARTLATIALQLRIIWCCLRWDDMCAKPPTSNGKIVTNTETGIVSTEILKHRVRGRFSEKIDYLRLTLLIPYGYADPQPNRGN